MKLVSVIIPFYKKKRFFRKTLLSIINQDYQKLEIIIIYDDTNILDLNFLKKISKIDKRIKLIINKKNIGAGLSRNKGMKLARGDFLAFIDSDDVWVLNKISNQLKFMLNNNFRASHTDYRIINPKDKVISYRKARNINHVDDILKSCDIGLSTVMIQRSLLNNNLKFPNLKTKEDFVFWIRLLKKKVKFRSLNKPLSNWRKTKNSLSSSVYQKLLDGFRVYYVYMKFSFIKSCVFLFLLSFNYFIFENLKII